MRTGKTQAFYLSNGVLEEIDRRRGLVCRSTVVNGILKLALDLDRAELPEDE